MSRFKNQKTFHIDGWKRIFCKNCGGFLCETYLVDKEFKIKKCNGCKNSQIVATPRVGLFNGIRGYFWSEPSDSCFTAVAD